MASGGFVSTIFEPLSSCLDPTNIWLYETECDKLPYSSSQSMPCTLAVYGDPWVPTSSTTNPCYPTSDPTTAWTDCPSGYSVAGVSSYSNYGLIDVSTHCCPTAFSFTRNSDEIESTINGEIATITGDSMPICRATSVELHISETITVTLATEPELVTTTTQWADDAVLFAEPITVFANVYTDSRLPEPSTCWGPRCPLSYEPEPTFPATITPAPSAQFTPGEECFDKENLWLVTTSCYLTASTQVMGSTPDWLTCHITHFGSPDWVSGEGCHIPYPPITAQEVQDTPTTFYEGCPDGFSAVTTFSGPGYDNYRYEVGSYDITYFSTACCPTQFNFQYGDVRQTQTVHEDTTWGLFVYPPPLCYATSVLELEGLQVPYHTTTNTMPWDKRDGEDFPTTVAWDVEANTLYAHMEQIGNTVFMGTHTCYTSCSSWFSYYYPEGTGAPFTGDETEQWGSTTTPTSSSSTGDNGSSRSSGATSTPTTRAPAPTNTNGGEDANEEGQEPGEGRAGILEGWSTTTFLAMIVSSMIIIVLSL